MHYQIVRPEGDHTGVRLELTPEPQPFSAGMFTYASGFVVPPQNPAFHVPATCCYAGWERIRAFAFRVHAHSLGRCAAGWRQLHSECSHAGGPRGARLWLRSGFSQGCLGSQSEVTIYTVCM